MTFPNGFFNDNLQKCKRISTYHLKIYLFKIYLIYDKILLKTNCIFMFDLKHKKVQYQCFFIRSILTFILNLVKLVINFVSLSSSFHSFVPLYLKVLCPVQVQNFGISKSSLLLVSRW